MKKSAVLFAFLFSWCCLSSFAQGAFKFEDETFDFGTIKEGVQAVHEFTFTNTGNAPIVISDVKASCGCTTPSYTKDPVLPGQKGSIKASYNSTGRPGTFHKGITITSNATEGTKSVFIKGTVEQKPVEKPVYTAAEKAASPILSLGSLSHNFGKVEKGQRAVAKVTIKNTGKSPLTLTGVETACNCVTWKMSQLPVPAGQTATLELTYNPRQLGERAELVYLRSNDILNEDVKFTLNANVVSSLTAPSVVREGGNAIPFK